MAARASGRFGFTLVELLVVIAIIGILIALLLPAVQAAREASRRSQCLNNIKQIALGVHTYADARKEVPTGAPRSPTPAGCFYLIGWIGSVLPYIEQDALHDEVDSLNNGNGLLTVQPWRSTANPHDGTNARYSNTIPAFFCPSSETRTQPLYNSTTVPHVKNQMVLHYRGVGGSSSVALIPGNANAHANWSDSGVIFPLSKITLSEVLDGTSNTLMIGEQSSGLGWSTATSTQWGTIQPWTWGYYNYNPPCAGGSLTGFLMIDHKFIAFPIGYRGAFLCNNSPFRSVHAGPGAGFAMADASVRFLSNNTSLTILQRLATRKGGEAVTLP